MSLDRATVARVATLARIKVAEEDLPALASELNAIVAFVEQLNEVDTSDVEPMVSVVHTRLAMRADVVTEPDRRAAVLANAPDHTTSFFTVPKVVE